MTDTPWDLLQDAERAAAEAASLDHRLATAETELDRERVRLQETATALAGEEADVQALERLSGARIWASLRGSRDDDLAREQAEREAALYRHEAQRLRTEQAEEAVRSLRAARSALGDVQGLRRRALEAVEQHVVATGAPQAAELAGIATSAGAARARLTEVQEAATAADRAGAALRGALDLLGRAGDWATYDTFFGGGMITDAMKYDRIDQAEARLREADAALRVLGRELADVGAAGVGGVERDGLVTTFDVWFDNIFSDWSVRSRIQDAAGRTAQALARVDDVRRRLAAEAQRLEREGADLAARREQLLLQR